jgi:hypothetical protein
MLFKEPRHLAGYRDDHSGLDRNTPYRSCGQECYNAPDIADAFADAVGRPVEAIAVPRAEWGRYGSHRGCRRAAPRAEMVNAFNSGWIHSGAPGTEHVDGGRRNTAGAREEASVRLEVV